MLNDYVNFVLWIILQSNVPRKPAFFLPVCDDYCTYFKHFKSVKYVTSNNSMHLKMYRRNNTIIQASLCKYFRQTIALTKSIFKAIAIPLLEIWLIYRIYKRYCEFALQIRLAEFQIVLNIQSKHLEQIKFQMILFSRFINHGIRNMRILYNLRFQKWKRKLNSDT